jgi:hypothetical protein
MEQTRRKKLTQEVVWGVCDELLRGGARPTIERIRERVGGSPNTVSIQLESWFKALSARLAALDLGEVPTLATGGLPSDLVRMAEQLWQTAKTGAKLEADRVVQEHQATADEMVAGAEEGKRRAESALTERGELYTAAEERRSLERTAQRLSGELGEAQGRIGEMGRALETAQSDLSFARQSIVRQAEDSAKAQKVMAEGHDRERKTWMLEVDRARGETTKAIRREEQASEAAKKLREEMSLNGEAMARLEVQLEQARAEVQAGRNEAVELRKLAESAAMELQRREDSWLLRLQAEVNSAAAMATEVRMAHEAIERLRSELRLRFEPEGDGTTI